MAFTYKSKYVSFNIDDINAPLLYCVYEIVGNWNDLEKYLRGTIGKDPMEPVGGDPGWHLCPPDDESPLYYAWVWEELGLEPNEGYYDEATVKYHIREAFDNMLSQHPDRRNEIECIFEKYDLKPNKEE